MNEGHLKHVMEFANGAKIRLFSEDPSEDFEGCEFTIYVSESGNVFARLDRKKGEIMRPDGKTFRRALRSVIYASEGETVVFLAKTIPQLEEAIHYTLGAIQTLNRTIWRFYSPSRELKIAHGKILFQLSSVDKRMFSGLRNLRYVEDMD